MNGTGLTLLRDDLDQLRQGGNVLILEGLFFNFVPESLDENLTAIDELGGPKYFNHYPWGWTWAGKRRSGVGSGRPTAAASATRSWSTGPRESQ